MDLGLLYHPFSDARHCVFRLLRLLEEIGQREVELQRLQIWDFYLLFPDALILATLPRGNLVLRRQLEFKRNSYDVMPDAKRAFARLEPIQQAAVRHLAVKDLIDPKQLRDGKVVRTTADLPDELASLIRERNAESALLVKFLTTTFLDIELYGAQGVRQRTDLFDHRYDIQRTTSTT
jgi:hypothetical protein